MQADDSSKNKKDERQGLYHRSNKDEDEMAPPPPWHLSLQVRSCAESGSKLNPCLDSLQDEVAVRQVLQIVVWWGIWPYLDEGVGIPLSQRLQQVTSGAVNG